ncbi:hypothetical protein [Acidobacterium sp. S8]|nr:hypothetical protein [Acidobacterium sp. S8]
MESKFAGKASKTISPRLALNGMALSLANPTGATTPAALQKSGEH